MNKRIKLKKGITHKSCDCRCLNFLLALDLTLITNNMCIRCKLKNESKIQNLLAKNRKLLNECKNAGDFTKVERVIFK